MKRILSMCLLVCMLFALMAVAANAADPVQNAVPISTNAEVTDRLSQSGENDYFRFTLSQDGAVSISFSHDYVNSGSWRVTLYDSNNEQIITFDCSESPVSKTTDKMGLPAGTYFLKVTEANWRYSDAAYRIKANFFPSDEWEKEFNDTLQTADELLPGKAINASLLTGDDKDYFRMILPKDGYITITFANEYSDNGNWRVLLYDENNEEITNYTFSNSPLSETTNKMGVSSGTYYLKVEMANWNASTIPYQLTVDFTASSDWEAEFNNTMQTANAVRLDTYKYGNLLSHSDVDFFRFSLSENQDVSFSFYVETIESGCWKMELLNANNEVVESYVFEGKKSSETTEKISMSAGEYFIKILVANWSHSVVPYGVCVNHIESTPTPPPTTPPSPSPTTDPSPSPTTPPPSTSFKDVNPSSWYAPYVQWAVQKGITNGTSATTFSPNADCTRAQIVTFLWRAAGEPSVGGSSPFKDVKSGDYFYKAVLWAVSKGITNGTSATTFSPGQGCTRAQVVTFFWRASGQSAPKSNVSPFRDIRNTGAYYYSAVLWAYENNVVNGIDEGVFAPNNTCTRAQIVTILGRYYG